MRKEMNVSFAGILSLQRLSMLGGLLAISLLIGAPNSTAQIQDISVRPELLRDVGIDQKLNNFVPLDLTFRDEKGSLVQLRQYFGQKPVILSLVYYQCPMLCTQVLDGLLQSLKELPMDVGKQFNVLTVSIDPKDKPGVARARQEMFTGLYGRPGAQQGWHFLTGEESQIRQLADAAGFRYAYDKQSGQFAHASVIIVLTPDGKISRYFYGIRYPSRDLRLGLVEASAGKIGSPVDQVLLFCYHYDPLTGKYGLLISRIIKTAGALTVFGIALLLFILFRSERYAQMVRPAAGRQKTVTGRS